LCLTVLSQLYSSLLTGAHLGVVGAVTLLMACGTASAQNWDNGGVGDSWMNPGNWDPEYAAVRKQLTQRLIIETN